MTPPAQTAEPETKTPPRPKSEEIVPVKTKTPSSRTPRLATPSVSDTRVDRNTPAPVAGGGETGGRGTDVANIRTEGIDFPFPGYLENIVREIDKAANALERRGELAEGQRITRLQISDDVRRLLVLIREGVGVGEHRVQIEEPAINLREYIYWGSASALTFGTPPGRSATCQRPSLVRATCVSEFGSPE